MSPKTCRRIALAAAIGAAIAASARAAGSDHDAQQAMSDYGVTLALLGETAQAESVFVTLLSDVRGDARALNNLGNLRLLKGELGVALAFYDRALRGDSAEAGIHLNRATALMLMGDDARAEQSAAMGVRLAGGVDKANALLGLKNQPAADEPKAAEKAYVTKEDVRALLRRAAAAVPADTSGPGAAAVHPGNGKKKAPTWRSAGPRASDMTEAASVLYWKR